MFVFSRAALQRFTGLAVRGPPGSALTSGLRRAYRRARHTQSVSQVEKKPFSSPQLRWTPSRARGGGVNFRPMGERKSNEVIN